MSDSTQLKISKLYQILSGKLPNKKRDYPLFDWDTMLDFFLAFYDSFCHISLNSKDKAILSFNKLYSENVKELKNLRISKNDFELLKTIGKGHFGEVIVVKEKNTNNVFAMKVLKKSATLSQENMAFYFEERDIMAFANSEWVTTLHYAFQDYDCLYLVMEFLPGGDLLALLNRYDDCIVDEDTCRFYLSEIIIATNCVHKIGYVHRDIKPENILIDLTGHVKLADFGSAAKLVNGNQVFGKMPVGTPEYIAPEVLTSMDSGGGKYGISCDYWSIGVVAYEMLFGYLPFEADSVLQLYSQIMNFKESLTFPDSDNKDENDQNNNCNVSKSDNEDNIVINADTKDLINGLICDQNSRYNYHNLAQHNFFKNMDWTTMKSMQPPFVPKVISKTDTSNFDDINSVLSISKKDMLNDQKTFSGKNVLPFVGFTFTRSLHQQLNQDYQQGHLNVVQNSIIDEMSSKQLIEEKESNEELLAEFKVLSNELEITKKDLEKSKKELNTIQMNMLKANNDNEYYIGEIEKQKNRYKELTKKFDELTTMNNTTNCDKVSSEFLTIFELEESEYNDNMKKLFVDIQKKYQDLKNEKNIAFKKVDETNDELKSLKNSMDILSNQNKNNEERHIVIYNELKENISSLELIIEKSKKESLETISKLKQSSINDNETIEKLKNKIIELEKSLIKKKNEAPEMLDNLKSHLNTATTTLENLKNENNNLNAEINKLIVKENEYKQQILKLENNIEEFGNEKHNFELNIIKYKQIISDKNISISNLNEKLSNLENTNVNLNCSIEIIQNKFNLKLETIKKLEEKIKNLELEIYNNDNQVLLNQIKVSEFKINSLMNELEDSKSKDEFNQQSLKTSQQHIKQLSETIEKLEKSDFNYQIENKQLIETIKAQKTSNYALTELIEKLKDDLYISNQEAINIKNEFEEHKNTSKENEYRLSETVKQQEKLIVFLQSMDTKTKKSLQSFKKGNPFKSFDQSYKKQENQIKTSMKGSIQKSIISDLERDAILRLIGKLQTPNTSSSDKKNSKSEEELRSSIKSNEVANELLKTITKQTSHDSNSKENLSESITLNNIKSKKSKLKDKVFKKSTLKSQDNVKSETCSLQKDSLNDSIKSSDKISSQNLSTNSVCNSTNISTSNKEIQSNVEESSVIVSKPQKVYLKDKTKSFASQATFDIDISDNNEDIDYSIHSFVEKSNLFLTVCMVCYTPMQFGISIGQCDKCSMKCHLECVDYIFYVCGSKIYSWAPYIPTIKFCQDYFSVQKNFNLPAMGWVNTLVKVIKTKSEWEQRWMVLTENEILFFKTEKTLEEINEMNDNTINNDKIESYNISPNEFFTSLCMLSSDTMLYAGTSDSKNFWNIEIPSHFNTVIKKKQDGRSFLYFSSSPIDKIYWVALLRDVFNKHNSIKPINYKNSLQIETIETIETQYINHITCILKLTGEISLISSGKNLYIFNQQMGTKGGYFKQLNGFEYISGMTMIKETIYMIHGKSKNILKIDMKLLTNEIKNKKPTKFSPNKYLFSGYHKKCHYINAGKLEKDKYLAVGIGNRLLIFKLPNSTPLIDLKLDSLINKLLFINDGLIYQTNLVSHLNLKSGECKIFLDQNDHTLAPYIFSQKNQFNYLINVLTITNKKQIEFILCYSGFFFNLLL